MKRDRPTLLHGGIVNVYTVYVPTNNFNVSSYQTLENCLFGAVKLTKNADTDKYWYFNYGIGFDRHVYFSQPSGGTGGNVIIFGVDMSSSTKIDNKKKRSFNSWQRSYTKIRAYTKCRKNSIN